MLTRRICPMINSSSVGDYFDRYPCDLNDWFRGDIVKKNFDACHSKVSKDWTSILLSASGIKIKQCPHVHIFCYFSSLFYFKMYVLLGKFNFCSALGWKNCGTNCWSPSLWCWIFKKFDWCYKLITLNIFANSRYSRTCQRLLSNIF